MNQEITGVAAAGSRASSVTGASTRTTRALLGCGVVAGPLFVVVAAVQILTRAEFDLSRHPLSLLSLGPLGWIQITNFVLTGLLSLACAVGMRRVLHPGRGGTWGPRLIGGYGLGLVAGGVFVADPALGFPPGTPDGIPDDLSWHGIVHGVAPVVAFLALMAACFVLARRFSTVGQRRWTWFCIAAGVVLIGLTAWPDHDTASVLLAVSSVVGMGWLSVVAARLISDLELSN